MPVIGYDGYYWETFEAVKNVRGLTMAKYIICFPPHQDSEGGLLHWHVRTGGSGIDALVKADPMWWPTYVSASMTKEELVKNFKDTIGAVAGMFPKSPFEPYAKEGKWMNSSLIYDNTSVEVNAAYNKIIKEFAGDIDVKSFPGEGTLITLSLPVAQKERRLLEYDNQEKV